MVFNYAFYKLYGYYVEYRAINMEKHKKKQKKNKKKKKTAKKKKKKKVNYLHVPVITIIG